jgi:hypothetical protein
MDSRFRSLTPRPDKLTERNFVDPLSLIDEDDTATTKQLILIHKELDKIKSDNKKKQTLIYKLKQDIQASKRSSNTLTDDKLSLEHRVNRLENYLETVIQKRKEEESDMKSYQFLLERIKEDKHALDKELKRQQRDLNVSKRNLVHQASRSKKLQELNLREKLDIQNLSQSVLKEKKIQEDTLQLIEKRALERSRAVTILEESSKHRELIADAVQGQVSNTETIESRNKILLNQFWFFCLSKRLQKELDKGGILEEPFQKIKMTTGMQSVEDILTRFLTREEAYKDLVSGVKESENRLKDMKDKLDSANLHLQALKIKEGNEPTEPQDEDIRNNTRSLINFKEMAKKYKVLIKNLVHWGKLQLKAMEVEEDSEDLTEILIRLASESEKVLMKVKDKMQDNTEKLEEVLFLNTSNMLSKNSFSKFFENQCRISPRKMSNTEEDSKLLIGKQ